MSFPEALGIIDTYMAFHPLTLEDTPAAAKRHIDKTTSGSSVGFMFKSGPLRPDQEGKVGSELLLPEMDRFGIERALVDFDPDDAVAVESVRAHPERFIPIYKVDPNEGMDALRAIERVVREYGVKAVSVSPAFLTPVVPINDKRLFPVYAKCIELGVPIFVNTGIPGPRIPFEAQYVGLVDEVCWFFPELTLVMRHGAEPWTDLAVKLMLKWPNLYYSTSAFAPKHYPEDIIRYANTRGADKIMYAGYFPIALSVDRIFSELRSVPFKDDVWPRFLRHNAARVLKL
jgi:predicted TIM-barrel fold metal-dependent hydrolase